MLAFPRQLVLAGALAGAAFAASVAAYERMRGMDAHRIGTDTHA
jgi:hypothetical protein